MVLSGKINLNKDWRSDTWYGGYSVGLKKYFNHNLNKGFTLVELLIASSISIIVGVTFISLVGTSYLNSSITNELQKLNYNTQRTANILTSTIKRSGFEGCKAPSTKSLVSGGIIEAPAGSLTQLIDPSTTNFPVSDLAQGAIRGFRRLGSGTYDPPLPAAVSTIFNSGAPEPRENSDIIAFYYTSDVSIDLSENVTAASPISIADNRLDFMPNDYAFIGDCTSGSIFQINNITGVPSLVLTTPSPLSYSQEDAKIRRAYFDIYYIGDSGRQDGNGNVVYSLFQLRNGQASEIAPSTYLLRFNYGITQFNQLESETFNNYSSISNTDEINFLQVSILSFSQKPVLAQDDTNNYQMLDLTISADDTELQGYERYLKQEYSFNVRARNSI